MPTSAIIPNAIIHIVSIALTLFDLIALNEILIFSLKILNFITLTPFTDLPPALQLKKLKLHYFSVNLVTATIIILFLTGVPPGDLISNRSYLLQRWRKIEINQ